MHGLSINREYVWWGTDSALTCGEEKDDQVIS